MLIALLLAFLSGGPLVDATAEAHRAKVEFFSKLTADRIADAHEVAAEVGIDFGVAASITTSEAGHHPEAVRYCKEWVPVEGGKKCVKEASCYRNCRRRSVWNNRLDSGRYGLRDAPPPGTSWIRIYNRRNDDRVEPECLLDRECSKKVFAFALEQTRARCGRKCWQRSGCQGEYAWLACWNGCKSCGGHIRRTGSANRAALDAFRTSLGNRASEAKTRFWAILGPRPDPVFDVRFYPPPPTGECGDRPVTREGLMKFLALLFSTPFLLG